MSGQLSVVEGKLQVSAHVQANMALDFSLAFVSAVRNHVAGDHAYDAARAGHRFPMSGREICRPWPSVSVTRSKQLGLAGSGAGGHVGCNPN